MFGRCVCDVRDTRLVTQWTYGLIQIYSIFCSDNNNQPYQTYLQNDFDGSSFKLCLNRTNRLNVYAIF